MSEKGDDGESACSETSSLMSYTLRYVSFTEVVNVCRVVLREPMYLCTCLNEEGGDGETVYSVTPCLLSYTLKIRQFRRGSQRLPGCVVRTDSSVYMCE